MHKQARTEIYYSLTSCVVRGMTMRLQSKAIGKNVSEADKLGENANMCMHVRACAFARVCARVCSFSLCEYRYICNFVCVCLICAYLCAGKVGA